MAHSDWFNYRIFWTISCTFFHPLNGSATYTQVSHVFFYFHAESRQRALQAKNVCLLFSVSFTSSLYSCLQVPGRLMSYGFCYFFFFLENYILYQKYKSDIFTSILYLAIVVFSQYVNIKTYNKTPHIYALTRKNQGSVHLSVLTSQFGILYLRQKNKCGCEEKFGV